MCVTVERYQVENSFEKEKTDGCSNHFFAHLQFGFTLSFFIKLLSDETGRNYVLGVMLYCQAYLLRYFRPKENLSSSTNGLPSSQQNMGSLSQQGSSEMVELLSL